MSDTHRSHGAPRPFSRRNFLMTVTAPPGARTLRAQAAGQPDRAASTLNAGENPNPRRRGEAYLAPKTAKQAKL